MVKAKPITPLTPTQVEIFLPNSSSDDQAPAYVSTYTEGKDGVVVIRNKSLRHPMVLIEFDDGTQRTYVGVPFILYEAITHYIPENLRTPPQL